MKTLIQVVLGLVIIGLIFMIVYSCKIEGERPPETTIIFSESGGESVTVIEIDGCEYIKYMGNHKGSISHKGNCKYCEERNKSKTKVSDNTESEFWWRD